MRIGIILDKAPGLSETFLVHHVNGLVEAGHEVVVFARPTPPSPKVHPAVLRHDLPGRTRLLANQEIGLRQLIAMPGALQGAGAARDVLSSLNPFRHGVGALRLRAYHGLHVVRRERFDLLHCHYAAVGWAFLPYREIFDVPLVTSFHGDHYGSFGAGRAWMLRRLFALGDAFVANSAFTRGELLRLGCAAPKVHVIPAIVDDAGIAHDAPGASAAGIAAVRAAARAAVPHVVTVARLDVAKGIHLAVRAVRLLLDRGVRIRYTVAGDGPYLPELRALVAELQLGDAVRFAGWMTQDEIYALYRAADVVVLPSVGSADGMNEAQGLVLQEAQLHRVPVVGSDLGGIPESLDYGRAGVLFPSGDVAGLAAALERVVTAPQLAEELVRHAVGYVRGKYTAAAVIPRLVALYRSLLDGRAAA